MSTKGYTAFKSHVKDIWFGEDAAKQLGWNERRCEQHIKYTKDTDRHKKLMVVRKVSQEHEIEGIRGTKGAFAAVDINPGTDCGIYTGYMVTDARYNKHLESEYDYVIKKEDYSIERKYKGKTYVFVPWNEKMALQFINDGRVNAPNRSQQEDYFNVEFRDSSVGGIPCVKVRAIKHIQKNEQLFVDYGDAYWNSRKHRFT